MEGQLVAEPVQLTSYWLSRAWKTEEAASGEQAQGLLSSSNVRIVEAQTNGFHAALVVPKSS
jgi:hypothetical protein